MDSDVLKEIRKDWLLEHLNEVEELIGAEISRLEKVAGEVEHYDWKPLAGRDADENHILRSHLKTRTLWGHYDQMGKALTSMAPVHQCMVKTADRIVAGPLETQAEEDELRDLRKDLGRLDPDPAFAEAALRQAIEGQAGRNREFVYGHSGNASGGVLVGGVLIHGSAGPDDVDDIGRVHQLLVRYLRRDAHTATIVSHWKDATAHRDGAIGILRKVRRSKDILRPCRFCRHLFGGRPNRRGKAAPT